MAQQLSVFLQNKPGKIAAITRALADAGIDIRALSVADTTDFGVLRMLVSDLPKAKEVLSPLLPQSDIVLIGMDEAELDLLVDMVGRALLEGPRREQADAA